MSVGRTSSPYVKGLLTAGFIAVLWAGVIGLLWAVEQQRPPSVRAAELSYLPKGEYLKVAVLGYRQMAADLIWLQAVQQLGGNPEILGGHPCVMELEEIVVSRKKRELPHRRVMTHALGQDGHAPLGHPGMKTQNGPGRQIGKPELGIQVRHHIHRMIGPAISFLPSLARAG